MDNQIIAIWVAIAFLFILIMFKSGTSFYNLTDKSNLMDLAEFVNIPSELKDVYKQQVVNKVAATAGNMVKTQWNRLTAQQKRDWKTQASMAADNIVNTINTQGSSMISRYTPYRMTEDYNLFDPKLLNQYTGK